ncbi:o-succinylbenzoate synthase [Sandaracinomonas limnophila]|uniref:O-succinylbenzoate synthase n=1 Tax=Sandaracinomonas limnophila TaxID=1862386 RepID=A0A437PXC1_9BACT|nr:o-succinylbenzoate synthase [Sandaracinomonas limnophila]RVU26905.1 o-succinylbenzoate synthase [Sandaracinomonas limnophila]
MNELKFNFFERNLQFHFEAGTSRGILTSKKSYFFEIQHLDKKYIGEAGPLRGLSPEFQEDLMEEFKLSIQNQLKLGIPQTSAELKGQLTEHPFKEPSFQMAFEMAFRAYFNQEEEIYFNNSFSQGKSSLPINGLIWMGTPDFMLQQIAEKLNEGYTCLKLKIGAIDFEKELEILKSIREKYTSDKITLRVDANGAFAPSEALEKLQKLAVFDLHSIEQPIKAGQWSAMTELIQNSPIPIALDEELIGIRNKQTKIELLETTNPPFIILKPSLLGGFFETEDWIQLAEERNIKWWITSALESNYGLNAIAQFTANFPITMPQGLGTGKLYSNNFSSSLQISKGKILNYANAQLC